MRQEAVQLLVAVNVALLEPMVFGPRSTVRDENRRRVGDATLPKELDQVVLQWERRPRVLVTRVAVDRLGDVHLDVERPFSRRHELLLTSRLDNPLPLLAVAGDVLLDRLRVVVLAVALEHRARVLEA